MRCFENETEFFSSDTEYLIHTVDFSVDGVGAIDIDYEIKKGREFESVALARDCVSNITSIDLNLTPERSPKWPDYDLLRLQYSFSMESLVGSNIWDAETGKIEFCQVVRLVVPAVGSDPKKVLVEELDLIRGDFSSG